MPLYRYRCPAGHETELLRSRTAETVSCSCGEAAERLSVYRVSFSGFAETPVGQADLYRDYKRYDEAAQQLEYQKARAEDAMQQKLPDPPLARTGEAKAKALERAGVGSDAIST